MKIAFLVNNLAKEAPRYTTTLLAHNALRRGHEVYYFGVEDFAYRPGDTLQLHACAVPKKKYKDLDDFLSQVQEKGRKRRMEVEVFDVLMLRNNPADDAAERPWAQHTCLIFGQEAARRGVIVLNDPSGLAGAMNKLYSEFFPEVVRPRTLITRDLEEMHVFIEEQKGKVVLKPLQGSGGEDVFLVRKEEAPNLNQMIETIRRHGYVILQEYLPSAAEGDIRLFVMNGWPLCVDGKYAAIRRVGATGDMRSNMHVGGKAERAEIGERELRLAELIRPRLIHDGMFLVGLDIAGDKILEINVFSPGGMFSAERFEKADFSGAILDSIERKVACRAYYPAVFENRAIAVL